MRKDVLRVSLIAALFTVALLFQIYIAHTFVGPALSEESNINEFKIFNDNFNPARDTSTIYFALKRQATISLNISDDAGNRLRSFYASEKLKRGKYIKTWYGDGNKGNSLPANKYNVNLSVETSTLTESFSQPVTILKKSKPIINEIGITPKKISPNGDGFRDKQEIFYTLSEDSFVSIAITKRGKHIRSVIKKVPRKGGKIIVEKWDGRTLLGKPVQPGKYKARILAKNKWGYSIKVASLFIGYNDTNWKSDKLNIISSLDKLRRNKKISRDNYKSYAATVRRSQKLLLEFKAKGRKGAYDNLGNIFKQIARISKNGQLTANRAYYLISITLKRNNRYFSKHGPPRSWKIFNPRNDEVFVYIYIPSKGLQPHPHRTLLLLLDKGIEKDRFMKAIELIIPALERRTYGTVRFKTFDYQFEYLHNGDLWASCLSQSDLLQAMAIAYKYSGNKKYKTLGREILKSYSVPRSKGGIYDLDDKGRKWFVIYGKSSWKILNGHLIALQGLKYYYDTFKNITAYNLLMQDVDNLANIVSEFDYPIDDGIPSWSKYSNVNYPADKHYHDLNFNMLRWFKTEISVSNPKIYSHFINKWYQGSISTSDTPFSKSRNSNQEGRSDLGQKIQQESENQVNGSYPVDVAF